MKNTRKERQELASVINWKCTAIFSHNRKTLYFVKLWNINLELTEELKNRLIKKAVDLGAINWYFKIPNIDNYIMYPCFIVHFPLNK